MKLSRKMMVLFVLVAALVMAIAAPASAKEKPAPFENSVVDVAIAVNSDGPFAGSFDTLIAAVSCTNLVKPLDRKPGVTVFAPTDDAFAQLGLNETNICDDLPRKDLSNILRYHIAWGNLAAADVVMMDTIRMSNGGIVDVTVNDDGVFVNDSQVIVTDVFADNGVIHVINAVLLP